MNDETIERLLALNRDFYASFAEHFAASRSVSDPALTSILPYLPYGATILDVGCGNGRLALLLDQERPGSTYVGVDAIPELIDEAREQTTRLPRTDVTFRVADVTRRDWTDHLPHTPFDCVVALAVLHHIPAFALRSQVLRGVAEVLKAEGNAILSTWRFLAHPRMRRKIVDWSRVGVDESELEPGDYLLDWKRGGRGLRYCHLVDEEEMGRLAAASGFVVQETFRAGGREGDLSLFAVLDRAPNTPSRSRPRALCRSPGTPSLRPGLVASEAALLPLHIRLPVPPESVSPA
ncbi:MAG: class I SAM-dependent methyltransferase [Anaerolineae bacterium]